MCVDDGDGVPRAFGFDVLGCRIVRLASFEGCGLSELGWEMVLEGLGWTGLSERWVRLGQRWIWMEDLGLGLSGFGKPEIWAVWV